VDGRPVHFLRVGRIVLSCRWIQHWCLFLLCG